MTKIEDFCSEAQLRVLAFLLAGFQVFTNFSGFVGSSAPQNPLYLTLQKYLFDGNDLGQVYYMSVIFTQMNIN